jgi:UDP-N-acetylglucosamine--N-acetylmuramyl-(pentapeptide) pyrophosphoryl-undecaprenol N-acetylglucosamine transferase
VCLEDELTVDVMVAALKALLSKPERLEKMAAGARSAAKPNAAEDLADLVEQTARR